MKIRQRLFLSNILMIAIPVAASMLVAYAILFLFARGSDNPVERAFPHMIGLLGEYQKTGDADSLIKAAEAFNSDFGPNNMHVAIVHDGAFIYPDNAAELLAGFEAMFPVMLSDGMTGSMSINGVRIYAEQTGEYRVFLADLRGSAAPSQYLGRANPVHTFLTFGFLLIIVILTNRILTHFLTRSITDPLNSLVNGVHELGDGNLEYRITYKRSDEFAQVCDDFNEMAEHLQSLIERQRRDDESRKELLAGISHDLRTPLTSIKAYVEGLLDGVAEDYPTQLKYLGVIRQKANDIDRIVDKLFLFSKLELGEFPFYREKLDIGRELEDMVAAVYEEYSAKGLDIELRNPLPGIFVYADPVQLRGAITNIFENSLNYKVKPQGSLAIECNESEDGVELRLTDDGPGVPEESIGLLFGVFYRLDQSRNNPSKGSGLGLAITSRLMQRMGGSLKAENAEEGGLRIIFTIPKYKGGEGHESGKDPDYRG